MNDLYFPCIFPRPGQLEVARRILDAYRKGAKLMIEAPNGFGKTSSALSAAYHIAAEYGAGVIYAVRTKREGERVLQEAKLFKEKFRIKVSDMLSMSDGCLLKKDELVKVEDELLPTYCLTHVMSKRCRYYERLSSPEALAWNQFESLSGVLNYATSNRFCPYMYSRRLSAESQIIVTTYNHILDKERLETLKATRENWREWMLICDEAHNISELAYTLNSRLISKKDVELAYSYALSKKNYNVAFVASTLINLFRQQKVNQNEMVLISLKSINNVTFKDRLRVVSSPNLPPAFDMFETRMQLSLMKLLEFCKHLAVSIDREDCRCFLINSEKGLSLKVCMLSADIDIKRYLFRSIVYLSATLGTNPSDFESYSVAQESAWNPSCVTLVDDTVTTAYSRRSEEMFRMISSRIENVRKNVRGPLAVFFTSYNVLHEVKASLSETVQSHCFVEEQSMSVGEQESVIDSFLNHIDGILMAVAGGKFAEGEDFKAGNLRSAVVVGLPLPPPSVELSERLKYISSVKGRKYAYESLVLVPAVNRVVQSAGRVVRNQRRKGVVILMDKRFAQRRIQELIPFWLKTNLFYLDCSNDIELRKIIGDFMEEER